MFRCHLSVFLSNLLGAGEGCAWTCDVCPLRRSVWTRESLSKHHDVKDRVTPAGISEDVEEKPGGGYR